ncbi:MAG: hypothetical protein ABJR05_00475 [Balneola sp.]
MPFFYEFADQNNDGASDGFPKVIRTDSLQEVGQITPALTFTSSGTLADDSWNMIGNPYGSTIDWNGSTGTFGSGKIAPWQAFWVKAYTSNPTLSLYDSVRTSGMYIYRFRAGNSVITKKLTLIK